MVPYPNNAFLSATMVRKLLQPFYTVYVLFIFVVSVLFCLPFIALISLGNNFKARKAIYLIVRGWAKFWLFIVGMPVTVKGVMPEGRKFVIVANHISYLDTLVIFPAISSYFRPLGKKEITSIPVLGFIYRQVVILVDRSSAMSRAKSMRLMWRSLRKEGNIMIFPEGTFNETGAPLKTFYDGAFRLALTSQVAVLPLIFPDTNERWHYSGWWKIWPGRNRAVFLPPVEVEGMDMDQLPALKQLVYQQMEQALIKYENKKP